MADTEAAFVAGEAMVAEGEAEDTVADAEAAEVTDAGVEGEETATSSETP